MTPRKQHGVRRRAWRDKAERLATLLIRIRSYLNADSKADAKVIRAIDEALARRPDDFQIEANETPPKER